MAAVAAEPRTPPDPPGLGGGTMTAEGVGRPAAEGSGEAVSGEAESCAETPPAGGLEAEAEAGDEGRVEARVEATAVGEGAGEVTAGVGEGAPLSCGGGNAEGVESGVAGAGDSAAGPTVRKAGALAAAIGGSDPLGRTVAAALGLEGASKRGATARSTT
jgi:hypothetical protein